MNKVAAQAVHDGVGEAMKVEFAIIASHKAPPFRFDLDASQCRFELFEEFFAQAALPLVVPQGPPLPVLGWRQDD